MPPNSNRARASRPTPLNRDAVLRTAVAMADAHGIEAINMRNVADELGVVPMALYKHVANKDALLDGMVDVVVAEIGPAPKPSASWKRDVRRRILAARGVMRVHPWARRVVETRTSRSPIVLEHLDSVAALFLAGGLTPDLVHHSMHAIGSRVWGFTQDVFETDIPAAPPDPAVMAELAARLTSLAAVAGAVRHKTGSSVGYGCDDDFEFEFALDMLLDGIQQRHEQGWRSSAQRRRGRAAAKR